MPEGRDTQGRFLPGTSGCPGGMVSGFAAKVQSARARALKHCPRAVERLSELMSDRNGKVAVTAAVALLRVGGVLTSEVDAARVEREIERRLRVLIEEAEAERHPPKPAGPPLLEAV